MFGLAMFGLAMFDLAMVDLAMVDPSHGCPGEALRRHLPVTLAGVSGYHWA
jgi:hypothetical protein